MNRSPREKSEAHLAWIRSLPSVVRMPGVVEAAHIRFADPMLGKRYVGMGEKPHDKWTVPLAADAHRIQHTMAEREFWMKHGIHPLYIAAFLWIHSGDDDAGLDIIAAARSIGQW